MKPRSGWALGALVMLAGVLGYVQYQDTLVPVPLASGKDLFVPAAPEYGEDAAVLEALLPAGEKLQTFLANQSDLTLLETDASGRLVGQLLSDLAVTRHGRRWRLKVRPGWRLQRGGVLDAAGLAEAVRSEVTSRGGEVRNIDTATIELRFKVRPTGLLVRLTRWRVPGTGPFIRQGTNLTRFEGFIHGRTGIASLRVSTDPALMESHAWADGLASGRWALTAFPGQIGPEDMAKARLAPYDELHLKDGSVWFLSRRMRRLRPDVQDWSRTRLFGIWKGSMDLPYDPLGL
ncbi:MAG TPA: hypothetical protein VJ486_12720 [Geothrix sp.]|nr:hypothetical protein [Geothrix sp.]